MGEKVARVRMRIFSRIRRLRKLRGYTLISVLLALVLLTTTLFAAQRIALGATTRLSIDEGLAKQSDVLADLVAVGGALNVSASPVKLEKHGLWVRVQSAAGLVDVNAAPPELVMAVFREVGVSTLDAESRLEAYRIADNPDFQSLPEFFQQLRLSTEESERIAPFLTAATGYPTVDPDLAPSDMQTAIARAIDDLTVAPEELEDRDMRLVMTASDPSDVFKPRLYVERLSDAQSRLLAYR